MTKNTRGLLISFDGVDSSGKETQAKMLVERLQYLGHTVHRFETPDYTTPSGQELKRRLQNADGTWQTTPWEEKAKLFAANRAEHREEVLEALEKGDIVIYDRYVPSSLAFMIIEGSGVSPEKVIEIVEAEEYTTNNMPHEDISIFLDVSPEVAGALLAKRKVAQSQADEYTDHLDVQKKLYAAYELLCKDTDRFARIGCVVDEQLLNMQDTAELIWTHLITKFPQLEQHG